jgi:hypothetical protein
MPQELTNLARQDPEHVPADDEEAVQHWAKRLGTSPEFLRRAIEVAGDRAHDIRVQLGHLSANGELSNGEAERGGSTGEEHGERTTPSHGFDSDCAKARSLCAA